MSRIKRFAHSFLSGYAQLGANVFFTLASAPLALHYLSADEFGLWIVTSQIAGYIALMDFGLNASAARIFIDYKDEPQRGEYGGIIQTAADNFKRGKLLGDRGEAARLVVDLHDERLALDERVAERAQHRARGRQDCPG